MLKEEAVWLGQQLERLDPTTIYPMCDLGSGDLHYRTVDQPFIDTELFARARALGHEVVHVDRYNAAGVDLVGDFSDINLAMRLSQKNFRSVMCCNVLEHVVDRQKICDMIISFVPSGGYIIVSVPNNFPYHEDPIDTMFRPDIEEVARLFPGTEIINAKIVDASRFRDIGSWRRAFRLAARVCVPIYRPRGWAASVRYLLGLWPRWRGGRYRVTCVVLRRSPPARV